jgi:3,4-dihydroxy 2-butanone 4-phosphate synthase/GTP cyclohydrolase II
VLVILNYESGDADLLARLKGKLIDDLDRQEQGDPQSDAETLRTFGAGAQILADIGVSKMRVLSGSPLVMHSLAGFDLEVVEFITT